MDVNCTGSVNCYTPSGTIGVLSTSNSAYQPAFKATLGWDFATGIGTVNAFNLVNSWPQTGITAVSGAPQTAVISSGFAASLVAKITDAKRKSGDRRHGNVPGPRQRRERYVRRRHKYRRD